MAPKDEINQDALAAEWGVALEQESAVPAAPSGPLATPGTEEAAAQWAAMADDGSNGFQGGKGGAERILNQDEIDSMLGFNLTDVSLNDNSGIRAIIDSAMVSYERLPMLEIIFDRLVRLMTTSLRNFTSDNVEVSLDRITSVRFGDYMNSIPLPAVLCVFKAEEWQNFGLATVDSSLIYSMIDVLLGGRRGQTSLRIEGRPYTTIETNLVKRLVEVVLADAEQAFLEGLLGIGQHHFDQPLDEIGFDRGVGPALDAQRGLAAAAAEQHVDHRIDQAGIHRGEAEILPFLGLEHAEHGRQRDRIHVVAEPHRGDAVERDFDVVAGEIAQRGGHQPH